MMGPMSQAAAAALGTKPSASVTGGEAESMRDAAVCWWFVMIMVHLNRPLLSDRLENQSLHCWGGHQTFQLLKRSIVDRFGDLLHRFCTDPIMFDRFLLLQHGSPGNTIVEIIGRGFLDGVKSEKWKKLEFWFTLVQTDPCSPSPARSAPTEFKSESPRPISKPSSHPLLSMSIPYTCAEAVTHQGLKAEHGRLMWREDGK